MIKFAHIAPKTCMELAMAESTIHMALYHLTNDDNYCKPFREAKREVILDNSFYELGACPSVEALIRAGQRVNADYIVLPDGTLDGLVEIKAAGFKVMAVPAGPKMVEQFEKWMRNDDVDLVGLSFFHSRLAVGSDNKYDSGARFNFLQSVGNILHLPKKVHCLGMGDTVHEIQLLRPYWDIIRSWDSSAATWLGLHNIHVKHARVKISAPVNFDTLLPFNSLCAKNIQYINSLVEI